MGEFTPINTQEEFDAAISSRLKRERESLTKSIAQKYADDGYMPPDEVAKLKAGYDKQIGELNTAMEAAAKKSADFEKSIAEKDAAIKRYETASVKARVAHETGLPYELASRLSGETEDEIRKDAEALSKLVGTRRSDPKATNEPGGDPGKAAETLAKNAGYRKLLAGIDKD